MTLQAIAPPDEKDMEISHLWMTDIFSDPNFNIRGEINRSDVVELARNIDNIGLLQPITVQPRTDLPGYKFRLVVGHRRFAAYQFLDRETIPAIIRAGLSEMAALALNFTENIERKNLNILQEAKGIERFVVLGATLPEIAKATGQGKQWVNIRYGLLAMPPEIQQDAAANFLTQGQIKDLIDIRDPGEQLRLVKAIKEAKLRGESRLPKIGQKKTNPTVMKRRTPDEIYDMMDHILDEMGTTNLGTRALAWANGEISDLDFYRDLVAYAKANGLKYNPPPEVQRLVFPVR